MSATRWSVWRKDAWSELAQVSASDLLQWLVWLSISMGVCALAWIAQRDSAQLWQSARVPQQVTMAAPLDQPLNVQELATTTATSDTLGTLDGEALRRLSETALALHARLQQHTDAPVQHASNAGRIAGLTVAMRQDRIAGTEFWQPLAQAINELELAVAQGVVVDDAATSLITELRSRYSALRITPEPTLELIAPNTVTNTVNEQPTGIETAAPVALPWALNLLPWLALSLPILCVLFAVSSLRKRVRARHNNDPRASYTNVSDDHVAQSITAAAETDNKQAAERRTQAAILQLLDEMEPLAEGDLTREATVGEDITGALADAFNHAVHELRRLVQHINQSSGQVRAAVSESRERTFKMAKQGAVQAREVARTHEHIEQMRADVQTLSNTCQQVALYAKDVAERTKHAARAVELSSDSLATMRNQADVAERSMRRLVSSTQGIDSRLVEIQATASRTDLLALNSTIKAVSKSHLMVASVGDVDDINISDPLQNFAELATDVSALATVLGTATRDIDQLADVIRDEANDSLGAVAATVTQVGKSERLSKEAHSHLSEIAIAAEALGSAIGEIATRTAEQAQGVVDVASTTQVISEITHDTANALSKAVEDLQKLENLSNSLDASAHGFRLPESSTS